MNDSPDSLDAIHPREPLGPSSACVGGCQLIMVAGGRGAEPVRLAEGGLRTVPRFTATRIADDLERHYAELGRSGRR